jgi:hypothetical protein
VAGIQKTLKRARDLSLIQRTPFAFALEEKSGAFWLEKNGVLYSGPRSVPEDISIKGKPIVFLPKGNSTGGLITITNPKGRGYYIEVDPVTGTATVERL